MSEMASLNKKTVYPEAPDEGGESSGRALEQPLQDDNDSSGDQGAASVAENSESSLINAAATSPNEESEQPAAVNVKAKQSDETIENLVALFRDFLEAAPNPASNPTHTQRNKTGRKRFFGLTKGSQPETGSNNQYDYEWKYPRDRPGEEAVDNARIWLTYLDEAEAFDREIVNGWKETADVLLVFAGLFSGVVTTFVSQASQSLRQDNTQVSASLLFEIAQILRAQASGIPINIIPNSTSTPTSPFTPSRNALLVNGLWFTSLAIALSTALFAVLAKQWLYYYLSSITGTAHEKVRARQLRLKGFELWEVGAIVDLLPILLHLAVGIFLTGIIILLFPLEIRVAWTIVIITSITYFLYFISAILPIWYPACPYTTSLTIYLGVLVVSCQTILHWISRTSAKGFQAVWGRINSQVRRLIRRFLQHTYSILQHAFFSILKLAGVMRRGFGTLLDTIFTEEFPKFTKWREENIKKAIETAISLDFEALDWLYTTSPNRSVHRIIARCAAMHPIVGREFALELDILNKLRGALEISQTNIVDLRYGLCLDLLTGYAREHWHLLRSIPDVEECQLEEAEGRSYSHIAENVLNRKYDQIMNDLINGGLELPLVMWCVFFKQVLPWNVMAVHILTCEPTGLFEWKSDPTRESIRKLDVAVSFRRVELGWWKFEYLHRHFFDDTEPDYSLDKAFDARYLLLIAIYRDLTSDEPLIADKEQRQKSLSNLFVSFWTWLRSKPHVPSEQYLAFFIDVCCADAFWSESMTHHGRETAGWCLNEIWDLTDPNVANEFPFTECDDLYPMYQWCSRDLNQYLLLPTAPIFTLLLMPRNRTCLCTLLSHDPDRVSHFINCFRNLGNCRSFPFARKYMYPNIIDILKNPKVPFFTILYNSSVLVQVWKFFVFHKFDAKKFLLVVKSKLDQDDLDGLYTAMTEQARSDDSEVDLDNHARLLGFDNAADILHALEVSVHWFGQIIRLSPQQLESTIGQSAPERAADRDPERGQAPNANANEREGYRVFHAIKKMSECVRPRRSDDELELADLHQTL